MNTSKLLFGLQAPLHSLTAKPLQNISLPCQGELKSQQDVRAFESCRLPDEDFPTVKGPADLIISASRFCCSHPEAGTQAVGPTVSFWVPASACLTWSIQHNMGLDGVKNYCVAVFVPPTWVWI